MEEILCLSGSTEQEVWDKLDKLQEDGYVIDGVCPHWMGGTFWCLTKAHK